MADNATASPDTGLLPRTYFKAPRVPLDLRALLLALIGYAVFRAGNWVLNLMFDPRDPVASFFDEVLRVLHIPYLAPEIHRFVTGVFLGGRYSPGADGGFWVDLVGGLWTLAVWGFFGQAIHRITSLRIARDEGLSLRSALAFAAKNFVTVAYCPLIVCAAIGVFYGCNALAGLLLSIPWIGGFLGLVLVPLAVISTLLILLIAIGGVVGLPLTGAAAAWERNGSLDAISRAFSYVFARPLQFFWNYFLILLFTGVILLAGTHFTNILVKSVDAGLLRDAPSMIIDTDGKSGDELDKMSAENRELYRTIEKDIPADRITAQPTLPRDLSDTGYAGVRRGERFAEHIEGVKNAPWGDKLTIFIFWIVLNLIRFGIAAAALWWFFGATTSVYADLRADVDGTEEDEIYLEEEQEDFEALAKPDVPAPGTPPPSSTLPPATPPASTPPAAT